MANTKQFKNNWVLGFLICEETKDVLLIRKAKPKWQEGYLNGIGGTVEKGESPLMAMIREFDEESKVKINDWTNFAVITDNLDWVCHCFIAITNKEKLYQANLQPQFNGEIVKIVNLTRIHTANSRLLGNVAWLVHMGVDYIDNNKPFEPPYIQYHKDRTSNAISLFGEMVDDGDDEEY